ncbi:MAG: trypsin-like peptidase domain-containing protein [Candidatus Zixiibacteriota bacterium]
MSILFSLKKMRGRVVRNGASHSSDNRVRVGAWSMAAIAVLCTILGVYIASGFQFSPPVSAKSHPDSYFHEAAYPLVERGGEWESPFVGVVERVKNAVVNISARSREEEIPWWHRSGDYSTSSGSGFFFREDGYILTNYHVVKDAERLTVWTSSGYKYDGHLVGGDAATDLAVIKVKPEEPVVTIPFGKSDEIKVGDWAIAIGNPFPQQGLDRTVTVGVISAMGRSNLRFGRETPVYQDYIQTDASINPGNSGGPLLNLRGQAIGVNAAISSPTGSSVGIGFAVPINLARAIVPDLIEYGKARRGWLGVYLNDVSEREAKRQGLESVKGVKIDSVFHKSPAAVAGIKPGDIVVGFNNSEVENAAHLSVLVSTVHNGQSVPVEIVRDRKHLFLSTTVADREAFLASQKSGSEQLDLEYQPWMGMELLSFTKAIAQALGMKYVEGILVGRVYPNSPADRASIARGTIILQINKVPVTSLDEVTEVARGLKGRRPRIPLIIQEPDGTIARRVMRP